MNTTTDTDHQRVSVYGHLATSRAERYLTQLCEHLNHMRLQTTHDNGAAPPVNVRQVNRTGADVHIVLDAGHVKFTATHDRLSVQIDAENEESARQLQTLITHRLTTIARRERISVEWTARSRE